MYIYIGFLSIVCVWSIFVYKGKFIVDGFCFPDRQKKKLIIGIIALGLIAIAFFRSPTIGADTEIYLNALDDYRSLNKSLIWSTNLKWSSDFEFGYIILTKLCAMFNFDNQIFMLSIAVLIYIPICVWLYKYSEDPVLSIFLYFGLGIYEYSLGLFRQMIAMSITIIGFKYIKERKIFRYTIMVLIAVLFHKTAIVVYPLYFISKIRPTKSIKMLAGIEIITFILSSNIIGVFIKIFPEYSAYFGSRYDGLGGSYLWLILLNAIIILCYIATGDDEDEIIRICFSATLYAIIIQIIAYSFSLMGRIVPYLTIYIIILIPNVLKKSIFRNKQLACIGIGIIAIILAIHNLNESVITPYVFWNR